MVFLIGCRHTFMPAMESKGAELKYLGHRPRRRATVTMGQLLREKSGEIRQIAARHGAHNIRVFGSVARGEAGAESDIDLLIDTGPTTSSWFPAGLILDLEKLLGCRVEIVTEKALNPDLRDHVFREAVPL
jgi:predicted nucleotidyltransferase